MITSDVKLRTHLQRKTKRELIDMYLYQTFNKRKTRENILHLRYEVNKLMIMFDPYSRLILPMSEKQEILNHLQEVENILKFNQEENEKDNNEQEQLTNTVKRYFELKAKGITTEVEALEHRELLNKINKMVGIK
jgi:hypothetical protein